VDTTLMAPPKEQKHFEAVVAIGDPPTMVREGDTQGAAVTGVHGIGVSTPRAAEVAAATVGLASELHIPKGRMFTNGLVSRMLATGRDEERTRLTGRTFSTDGATPKLHLSMLPVTRGFATRSSIRP
jgi:hypothetical protein